VVVLIAEFYCNTKGNKANFMIVMLDLRPSKNKATIYIFLYF